MMMTAAQLVPAEMARLDPSYRERERIKRKAERWLSRLESLPALEQKAIRSALLSASLRYMQLSYRTRTFFFESP